MLPCPVFLTDVCHHVQCGLQVRDTVSSVDYRCLLPCPVWIAGACYCVQCGLQVCATMSIVGLQVRATVSSVGLQVRALGCVMLYCRLQITTKIAWGQFFGTVNTFAYLFGYI